MTEPLGVAATARAVAEGRVSAVEIAERALERARAWDAHQPQTWISRLADEAVLARASAVDARLERGERLPLAGATFAIKDNLDLAGAETTGACPAFAYGPDEDAVTVARLVATGAIPIGKTNLDQFATGLTGARSPHGAPACVFNRQFVSGGSSSGSAVAAAAGVTPFALGTDTAGSGRVPAAFNGLVGFKPTRGRWSNRGLVPACASLDCVSLFTTDVADAMLIDSVLMAFDVDDPWSRQVPPLDDTPVRTLGVPRAADLEFFGDGESARLFEQAMSALGRHAKLVEVDVSALLACGRMLYDGPWLAERAAALAPMLAAHPVAVHPVVRAIVQPGLGMAATQMAEGLAALRRHARTAQAMWAVIDALVLPTAPTVYRIAEVMAEPFGLNARLGTYTTFVNLLDMAAIAAPAGWRANGTGFGVSLIGPAWSEPRLAGLAEAFAAAQQSERPSLDHEPRPETVKLAVVGAHLAGMPLHWQLASRGARLSATTRTAPTYRLYAMAGSAPPKPALAHVGQGGAAIAVEVYELDVEAFGAFVAEVPPPLAIGTVSLESGEAVKGFVAEPRALEGARDITEFGGWRAFVAQA